MVNLDLDQFQEQTVLFKKKFRDKHPQFENRFKLLEEKLSEQIEVIEDHNSQGKSTIPELDFHRIANGNVEEGVIRQIQKTGTVVIRNVFPRERAEAWFQSLEDYVQENDYFSKQKEGLDRYFSDLKSDRPQIYGIYWSKAQIEARQDEAMGTRGPFSTVYGISSPTGKSIFIPTGNAPMQIGSGCENLGIKVWVCPLTWMPVRWNAGWTRLTNVPMRKFLKPSGRNITPFQEPFAMRPRGLILLLFAGPSGPGRVGPL